MYRIIFLATLLVLAACAPQIAEIEPMEEPISEEQAKKAIKQLAEESQIGIPTQFDFSKEHHYTVYKYHLQRAQYSPEKYPQLHRSLEEAKAAHIKNGGPAPIKMFEVPTQSALASGEVSTENLNSGYAVSAIQQITSLGSRDGVNYNTSGISTVPGPIAINSMILGMYDMSGNAIGPSVDSTVYGSGDDLITGTTGKLPAGVAEARTVLTYFYEDSMGTPFHGYVYGATSAAPRQISNINPAIKVSGNTSIIVCLGRQNGNCDYDPAGGSGTNVILPITGSIIFGGNIDPIKSDSSNVSCFITIARTDGGCMIKSTSNFFADPNTRISNDTLSWNLDPAQFQPASGCLQANTNAIYTFTVSVEVNGLPVYVSITNAPSTPGGPYDLKIPGMQIYFSCLPDGTLIRMADGSVKTIENVASDEEIIADTDGRTLKVHSVMRGKDEELYVLKTANGRILKATSGHAIITLKDNVRRPVTAENIVIGDIVITEDGPSLIEKVEVEPFDGHVWNLVLDQTGDMDRLKEDQSTYYANGVLVGDSYMQAKYGRKQLAEANNFPAKIPEKWLKDYENYLERH